MKHLITWCCCLGLLCALVIPAHGQDKPTLRLVQTIPLPGVSGRLDHMAIDLEGKRERFCTRRVGFTRLEANCETGRQ